MGGGGGGGGAGGYYFDTRHTNILKLYIPRYGGKGGDGCVLIYFN